MLTFEADPNKQYPQIPAGEMVERLGLIPEFMRTGPDSMSLKTRLETNYQFFHSWTAGGFNVENGVYFYPGDEPLQPLALYSDKFGEMYQYPFGIMVWVPNEGTPLYTRAD